MKFLFTFAAVIAFAALLTAQQKEKHFSFSLPNNSFVDSLLNRHGETPGMPKYVPEVQDKMPVYYPADSINYKMQYFRVEDDWYPILPDSLKKLNRGLSK